MTQLELSSIQLGGTGLVGSRIGIGTWAIGGGWGPQPEARSLAALHQALDMGCLLIDTAALYGNGRAEHLIAQAFKERGSRVTTITKIYPQHYHWAPSPGTPITEIYPTTHIRTQVEASLRRLATDCLDAVLFQTWCPSWSEEMEWYETMRDLQRAGKIRAFGISVSDHRPEEANGVIAAGRVDLIEAPYSLLDQRAATRLFPLAQSYHVSIIARTPLASGALTGRWYAGMKFHRQDWRKRVFRGELFQQTLQRVARIQSLIDPTQPLAQLALRFCLSHPAVTTVIPGVRSAEQVEHNLMARESALLPQETLDKLTQVWQQEMYDGVRTSIGEEVEG
ncbi:MAG TPA: aldo/keto reductase [Ktedonobacteraceae bacterium]|nr:aldo/keto reductase [Ktedonobacteraceae bacterium]